MNENGSRGGRKKIALDFLGKDRFTAAKGCLQVDKWTLHHYPLELIHA